MKGFLLYHTYITTPVDFSYAVIILTGYRAEMKKLANMFMHVLLIYLQINLSYNIIYMNSRILSNTLFINLVAII